MAELSLDQAYMFSVDAIYDLVDENGGWVGGVPSWSGSIKATYDALDDSNDLLVLSVKALKSAITAFEDEEDISLLLFSVDELDWCPDRDEANKISVSLPSSYGKAFMGLFLVYGFVSDDELASSFIRWAMMSVVKAATHSRFAKVA
jgi:hypothetical protein